MAENDLSDDDWFNQDEDELVNKINTKTKEENENKVEHITIANTVSDYSKQCQLNASVNESHNKKHSKKIATSDLRKTANLTDHEAFLYAFTCEPSFFIDQITPNDSLERAVLYLRIVGKICSLELLDFQSDLLGSVMNDTVFLEHLRIIATKLFTRKYISMWKDEIYVDQILSDLQKIYLQSFLTGVIFKSVKAVQVKNEIIKSISVSDSADIVKRTTCIELASTLKFLQENLSENDCSDDSEKMSTSEIYPTLEEILSENKEINDKAELCSEELVNLEEQNIKNNTCTTQLKEESCKNVCNYVDEQKQLLRTDFLRTLHVAVKQLQATNTVPAPSVLFDDVCIVLNTEFLEFSDQELTFADILGSQRKEKNGRKLLKSIKSQNALQNLKTGSLLCFTASNQFENLVLATVANIDKKFINNGFVSIEIVRQYNIGNIYQKKFLMFEAPTFFEPYYNVYNFFKKSNLNNFGMKNYIIDGEIQPKTPVYLNGATLKSLKNIPSSSVSLNTAQRDALTSVLTQEFSLIQGPPGTGKTYLSLHLVLTLIQNSAKPVVVITYTNESLDKFLLKLSTHTKNIVRFGSQTRLPEIDKYNIRNYTTDNFEFNPQLKRLHYVTKMEFKEKFHILQKSYIEFDGTDESYYQILKAQDELHSVKRKLQTIRIMFHYYVAKDKSVIAMTTTCAARINFLFRLLKCEVVIFEEAAEILESHVVACLTPYTKHVIMIGDHMQLKPFISNHSRCISLFERLIKNNFQYSILTTQYRMRPIIADLLQPVIYKNLENAKVVQNLEDIRKMKKNLYFLDHDHAESKPESNWESSLCNEFEVRKLYKLANYLVNESKYTCEDIVILSPYTKQVDLIKAKLNSTQQLCNIRTRTVDSFQGLEANIVLLSLVRNNRNNNIGFLTQPNRICVALSRAKYGMYIIGNATLLAKCSTTWKSICNKLQTNESLGTEFPYE
ncbi:NFX1-type zinc finger-containing protein 1 [Teleopsis dalmanni]|uniref:NFX1-type zinc finger-containing protein 1 n=1 Tax=Teleopsis dalmanni TaxID=139649 RepID=UPI0018CF8A3F|nr:NFX1-type zinc finger-containing protein 1 [Teleopsis dalmanni]